jgi:hypothetical protein
MSHGMLSLPSSHGGGTSRIRRLYWPDEVDPAGDRISAPAGSSTSSGAARSGGGGTHAFTPLADGRTRMTDVVEFQSPLGPLGYLADGLVLDRYMPRLLRQRNSWLKTTLEASANACH